MCGESRRGQSRSAAAITVWVCGCNGSSDLKSLALLLGAYIEPKLHEVKLIIKPLLID